MRDPRYGLGQKNIGRELLASLQATPEQIVACGRYDDVWRIYNIAFKHDYEVSLLDFLKKKCASNDALCKKWMPRYSSKDKKYAINLAKAFNLNKQEYGKFIKCDSTTEFMLSHHLEENIIFEHVPSLAMIKYANTFSRKLPDKYSEYLNKVRSGKAKLNVSTTNVYDIYRNRNKIDAQLFFDQISKCKGSWLPIVDTSGSMWDSNDSIGKALSIGHYLAKCSSYLPNTVMSFSSEPFLIELGKKYSHTVHRYSSYTFEPNPNYSDYINEINSMNTGDCSRTNFGAVMEILKGLEKGYAPDYLVVLSDMEFDMGSALSKNETMELFKSRGIQTRIIWWNFNSHDTTVPEIDKDGNIFLSGYNPYLLSYLETGFDSDTFIAKLLTKYSETIDTLYPGLIK